jgi:ABC-type lipoprotein release transport system permease subunit
VNVAALPHEAPRRTLRSTSALGLIGSIAWRNLWRNPRRTWLSTGAIGFAVSLLVFAIAQQAGNYAIMIDNATGMLAGHLQIQRRGFLDNPRVEAVIPDVSRRIDALRAVPGVASATPRISAFVLTSDRDRSFAAQLLGVSPNGERALSTLPDMIAQGRYLQGGAEAFAGDVLARNLGANVGDELVVLGTSPSGGVAALALTLVGTFTTGIAELDRGMLEAPIGTVADAFELKDSAHAIVVRATSVQRSHALAEALRRQPGDDEAVVEWSALIPGLEQGIELDRIFGEILFAMIAAIVTIGVFNGFVMTIFERTREFGTLLAIGMRPRGVIGMLQVEAACLSIVGCVVGLGVGVPVVLWLERVGIPLGHAGEAMRSFHMADRMYPALNVGVILKPVVLMILCTQLAGLLPALRVRRILPVEALRAA